MQAITDGAMQSPIEAGLQAPQAPGARALKQTSGGGGNQTDQQRPRLGMAQQQNAGPIDRQSYPSLSATDSLIEGHHTAADVAQN